MILHPFLFAAYLVLFLYAHNISELRLPELMIPLAIIVCLALALWLLLNKISKDADRSGMMVSLLMIIFFTYGYFQAPLNGLMVLGIEIGRVRYAMTAWVLLLISGAYFVIKLKTGINKWTKTLNYISVCLVIISLTQIVWYEVAERKQGQKSGIWLNMEIRQPTALEQKQTKPDIYYLIFDRYAGSSNLKEFYNYDNSEFVKFLTDRKFYVAEKSHANYSITFLSLASSLNMCYFDLDGGDRGMFPRDRTRFYRLLQDNSVLKFLKARNYKTIHIGSWYGPTRENKAADVNINYDKFQLFGLPRLLLNYSMAYPLLNKLFSLEDEDRIRVMSELDQLYKIPQMNEPKFVFAHMLIPHDPYVFDRNGTKPTRLQLKSLGEDGNYLNQLIYTNSIIIGLVDTILSKSKTPPIIIIQSDEGPYLNQEEKYKSFDPKAIRKRTGILNAYYFPGALKQKLYPAITPVNTFRMVFNNYLNGNFKLLVDRFYYIGNTKRPFDITDVTNLFQNSLNDTGIQQ